MTISMKRSLVAVCVLLCTVIPLTMSAAPIPGTKPKGVNDPPEFVPENGKAITKRIWVPGIDEGFVPQGITWADGAIYVSGYLSKTDNHGDCRIYKVNANTGKTEETDHFDFLPKYNCTHAGGLAYVGNDILVVSDTDWLYRIKMSSAFNASKITAQVGLSGQLRGSFVDFDGKSVLIGSWEKADAKKAKGFYLPLSIFDTYDGETVNEHTVDKNDKKKTIVDPDRTISIPLDAQGAAFDPDGKRWIAMSNTKFGTLFNLDAKSGQCPCYETVVGIEDLAFDNTGKLWSVSEVGAIRFQKEPSLRYPLIFQIDPDKLRPMSESPVVQQKMEAYFFVGNQYYRFDFDPDVDKVDQQRSGIIGEGEWKMIPKDMKIDAAIFHPIKKNVYFFVGNQYYRFDPLRGQFDKRGTIGVDGWKWKEENPSGENPPTKVDAVIFHPINKKAYFFVGNQYYRFDFDYGSNGKHEGFDKHGTIGVDRWKGIPMDTKIDAAILHPNGKGYFFVGKYYYRFDFQCDQVDKVGIIGVDGWTGLPTDTPDTKINAVIAYPSGK